MRRALVGLFLTTLLLGTVAVAWQQRDGARADVRWPGGVSSAAAGGCDAESDARLTAGCRGVWVRAARRDFVPQGLALGPGRTAFVSGYHAARRGRRYCQVMVVDRRSGRTLERHDQIEWVEPGRDPVPCRHAGGLAASSDGLWLSQSDRLWLLDRDALLTGADPVLRVWRLEAPVRGSVLVRRGRALGITGWSRSRALRTHWVRLDDLQAPGVTLVSHDPEPGGVTPVRSVRAPAKVQGAASGPGGIWYASSTTYCGVLHPPGGGSLPFIPGAEGMAFAGERLWVVSESGAGRYQREGGRPVVPTLLSLDPADLDADQPTGCSWD